MPNTYKSLTYNLGATGATTVLTSTTTTLVNSLYASNVSSTNAGSISVIMKKSGGTDTYLIKAGLVPIQSTLQTITEPIVLENGDILSVEPSAANVIDIILSYLEIT